MADKNQLNNLNEDDDMFVTLDLDDNTQVECRILTIFEVDEQDYIALLPLEENGEPNEDGEVFIYRYSEDEDGNLHAMRVGTGRQRYSKSTPGWINAHELPVWYGDITKRADYKPYMGLIPEEKSYYARNSKGKMVPVVEEGWDDSNATPTHMLVMASSGCGTAYTGTVGMELLLDNIKLKY